MAILRGRDFGAIWGHKRCSIMVIIARRMDVRKRVARARAVALFTVVCLTRAGGETARGEGLPSRTRGRRRILPRYRVRRRTGDNQDNG